MIPKKGDILQQKKEHGGEYYLWLIVKDGNNEDGIFQFDLLYHPLGVNTGYGKGHTFTTDREDFKDEFNCYKKVGHIENIDEFLINSRKDLEASQLYWAEVINSGKVWECELCGTQKVIYKKESEFN